MSEYRSRFFRKSRDELNTIATKYKIKNPVSFKTKVQLIDEICKKVECKSEKAAKKTKVAAKVPKIIYFDSILSAFTAHKAEDGVCTLIDDFCDHVCKAIVQISKDQESRIDYSFVDSMLFPKESKFYLAFRDHLNNLILKRLRNPFAFNEGLYSKKHKTIFEEVYKMKIQDEILGRYIADALEYLCGKLVENTKTFMKKKGGQWELKKDELAMAWLASKDLAKIAKIIGFNIPKHKPVVSSKKTESKRLPKVWEYDNLGDSYDDDVIKQAVETLRGVWIPGDIIQEEKGYRGNGMFIIDKDNNPVELHTDIYPVYDAASYIPAWAVDMVLKKGFKLEAIKTAYSESRAAVMEYPGGLGLDDVVYDFENDKDVLIEDFE